MAVSFLDADDVAEIIGSEGEQSGLGLSLSDECRSACAHGKWERVVSYG